MLLPVVLAYVNWVVIPVEQVRLTDVFDADYVAYLAKGSTLALGDGCPREQEDGPACERRRARADARHDRRGVMHDEHYDPFRRPPPAVRPREVIVFMMVRARGDQTDSMRGSLRTARRASKPCTR